MARRALWRASPDDPRTPLGWLWGDLDYVAQQVLKTVARGISLLAAYFLFNGGFATALLLVAISATLPRVRLRRSKVESLLTLPPPVTPFPVTVETLHKGVLLGRDRGVVSFVDGWLQVDGKRADFGLRGADVKATKEEAGAWRFDLKERGAVRLRPDDRLVAGGVRESGLQARFAQAVAVWQAEESVGEGTILPPLEPHASGWARVWGSLFLMSLSFVATYLAFARLGMFWGVVTVLYLPGPSFADVVATYRRLRRSSLPAGSEKALP